MLKLTFEQWAIIADIYTPLLIIWSCRLIWLQHPNTRKYSLTPLLVSILIVYITMFGDEWFKVWPAFGADYSTHTAIALALVTHIAIKTRWKGRLVACLSLVAYLQLMHHQQYHTYLDMVSTVIYLLPMFWLSWLRFGSKMAD